MTVCDLLAIKGAEVHSIGLRDSILAAAQRMNERRIGSLAVLDGGELVGIITERDLLTRVIVERRDPVSTQVEDVMTGEVVCCHTFNTVDEVRHLMKNRRIRHLPVVDDGHRLLGLISIGDLNAAHAQGCEATIHEMKAYIAGRV